MNAFTPALCSSLPLPVALAVAPSRPRRVHVREHVLESDALAVLNALVARLRPGHAALALDQVATAARTLIRTVGDATPACIQQRLNRLRTGACLAADAQWGLDGAIAADVEAATAYVEGDADLIPDALPTIGRLDDAIVIEALMPRLGPELDAYADFCRVRSWLAARGDADGFDRHAWRGWREDDARLRAQRRDVFSRSYVPAPCRMLSVH